MLLFYLDKFYNYGAFIFFSFKENDFANTVLTLMLFHRKQSLAIQEFAFSNHFKQTAPYSKSFRTDIYIFIFYLSIFHFFRSKLTDN